MAAKSKKPTKATEKQSFRDRIVEFRRVKATELQLNPRNWRMHPDKQRAAMAGVLSEIGFAGAALARKLPNGELELIDGHLRAEMDTNATIPVLVTDLSEYEANYLLTVHDPISTLAEADKAQLEQLLREIQTGDQAVAELVSQLAAENDIVLAESESGGDEAAAEVAIDETYQVIVECRDQDQQKELYDALKAEGHSVRLLTI